MTFTEIVKAVKNMRHDYETLQSTIRKAELYRASVVKRLIEAEQIMRDDLPGAMTILRAIIYSENPDLVTGKKTP